MTFITHGKLRYLILLPLIFLLLNAVYYQYMMKEVTNRLLQEKFNQIAADVDILGQTIDEFVNTDQDWGVYDYTDNICKVVASIGTLPHTIADVYRENRYGLARLSQRAPDQESFDPRAYVQFNSAIAKQEQGRLILNFSANNQKPMQMYLYFRWVPTGPQLDNRFLVVVAVSLQSITTPMALWISVGQWVSMAITFILEAWLVLLVTNFRLTENVCKGLSRAKKEAT